MSGAIWEIFCRKTAIRSLHLSHYISTLKVGLGGGFEFLLLFLVCSCCGLSEESFSGNLQEPPRVVG